MDLGPFTSQSSYTTLGQFLLGRCRLQIFEPRSGAGLCSWTSANTSTGNWAQRRRLQRQSHIEPVMVAENAKERATSQFRLVWHSPPSVASRNVWVLAQKQGMKRCLASACKGRNASVVEHRLGKQKLPAIIPSISPLKVHAWMVMQKELSLMMPGRAAAFNWQYEAWWIDILCNPRINSFVGAALPVFLWHPLFSGVYCSFLWMFHCNRCHSFIAMSTPLRPRSYISLDNDFLNHIRTLVYRRIGQTR